MLRNSFILLDGVGNHTEQLWYENSITDWQHFLSRNHIPSISKIRHMAYKHAIRQCHTALADGNVSYFAQRLTHTDSWRLYPTFKDNVVFLDIETTGLSNFDQVTVVGLYDGIDTKMMIAGLNLDWRALREELSHYELIISFNGASFDLPFLKKQWPNVIPDVPHIDLRHACNQLGLRGGLKRIEKAIGIQRPGIIGEMHGGDAVRLWKMYKASGDDHYLNLLIKYNEEDIMNLKPLAEIVVTRLIHKRLHTYTNCSCSPKLINKLLPS